MAKFALKPLDPFSRTLSIRGSLHYIKAVHPLISIGACLLRRGVRTVPPCDVLRDALTPINLIISPITRLTFLKPGKCNLNLGSIDGETPLVIIRFTAPLTRHSVVPGIRSCYAVESGLSGWDTKHLGFSANGATSCFNSPSLQEIWKCAAQE